MKKKIILATLLTLTLLCGAIVAMTVTASADGDVAKIDETGYATLAGAIAAANVGDTIVLQQDATVSATIEINKEVTIDLNGKTVTNNAPAFKLLSNANFTIKGAGNFVVNATLAAGATDQENVVFNFGDGVNIIGVRHGTTGAQVLSFQTGAVTIRKVNFLDNLMTTGNYLSFGSPADVKMYDSSVIIDTVGQTSHTSFFSWDTKGVIKFYAEGCRFEQRINGTDNEGYMNGTTQEYRGKSSAIVFPADGILEGSSFEMKDTYYGYKWRGFVNETGSATTPNLVVKLDHCTLAMGPIDGGRSIGRHVNVTLKNCKVDDTYFYEGQQLIVSSGTLTIEGYIGSNGGDTFVKALTADGLAPADAAWYYCTNATDEYTRFYLTADAKSAMEGEGYTFTVAPDLRAYDKFNGSAFPPSGAEGGLKKVGLIRINNKCGTKVTTQTLTNQTTAVTENGTNKYLRWYACGDSATLGANDSYMDILLTETEDYKKEVPNKEFQKYSYFTLDYDIATDSEWIVGVNANMIGRTSTGAAAGGGALGYQIELDAVNDQVYFTSRYEPTKAFYVGPIDAKYQWHHITVIGSMGTDETDPNATAALAVPSMCQSMWYFDGQPMQKTFGTYVGTTTAYLAASRISLRQSSVFNENSSLTFDNFNSAKYPKEGEWMDLATLMADPTMTLDEANYRNFNYASYDWPEGDSSFEADADVEIYGKSLSLKDSVYINYYVKPIAKNESISARAEDAKNVKLLAFTTPQDDYSPANAANGKYLKNYGFDAKTGCYVFRYTDLTMKQMTDAIYTVACFDTGRGIVCSEPSKYSIAQYAYNKASDAVDGALVKEMMEFGGAAQERFHYRTDDLASAKHYMVRLTDAAFEDGFNYGLYPVGAKVTVTAAEQQDGKHFSAWISADNEILTEEREYTFTVDGDTGLTAVYVNVEPAFAFDYTIEDDEVTITKYNGTGAVVNIPARIEGYPVTAIGAQAFQDCVNLTGVTIPKNVTNIGNYAFLGCYKLLEVCDQSELSITAGSRNNGYVGYYAKNVYSSASGTGNLSTDENGYVIYTDGDEKLLAGYVGRERQLTVPSEITEIYPYAFYNKLIVTSVAFAENSSCTSIGNDAFHGCTRLESITIPGGVVSIGENAFCDCVSLAAITVSEGNECYHSGGNCLIETARKTLLIGCKTSVIPDDGSVTSVGAGAFNHCTGLTGITIPSGVTSIGDYAFSNCSKLQTVLFSGSSQCTSIGYGAFSGCGGLQSIVIPSSVESIGGSAFSECTGLRTVTFEENAACEIISAYAFSGCVNLASIEIPMVVRSIGGSAFAGCTALTIYCEAMSKPSGWDPYWNISGRPVVWDCLYQE